ncbi:1,2-phenylacetyl-CoA epoxidase subunit PaaC [Streptomyces sp. JJ36]|uniref:1,2-phenylacetyl-CoA epoxidase subunit PaaC n=1 Tax=Streptomyces sp. JJ36 TaxID=2736645 RepID=UPI001F00FF21|nr:1,2-phenylacetyl-CoA epoxidase subunit PaaC [Streptomyces sp. JJ36]MCF6524876.1 phenylacetate-CoA oxygenase subunit PaaC [Streptomyces sp. JJ36]
MSGTVPPAAPSPASVPAPAPARAELALADDALVLSHRLGEWAGHAPVLEEEVALANLALDLLGQARALYADLEDLGTEDELAYLREERAFRNCQLVEQPNGDFAATIARQLLFSTWQELLYGQLSATGSGHPLAVKAVKEVAYHRDHAEHWTLRLGDGTGESHARMQSALTGLWRYTDELFQPLDGWDLDLTALRTGWDTRIGDVLGRAGLEVPAVPGGTGWTAGAGRQGLHTEPFGRMLAEMQHLHRSHPGASW